MESSDLSSSDGDRFPPLAEYPKLECKKCRRSFSCRSTLRDHDIAAHLGGSVQCRKCSATFSSRHSRRKHVRRIHDKEINAICNHCGKGFFSESEMNLHLKLEHRVFLAEFYYKCKECLILCQSRDSFKGHLKFRHHATEPGWIRRMTSRSKKAHAGDLNRRSHVQGKDSARKISPASDGALRFESKRSRSTDKNASDSHPTNQGDTPGETIKNRSPNRLHSKRIPQSEQSGSNLLREDLAMSGEDEDNTDAFSVASISNTLDETAHNETDFSNLEETLSDHSQQSDGDLVVTSDLVSASNMIDPNFSPFARPARKRKT